MSHNARAASQNNTDNRIPDWSGTNDLLGVWLYELKRARSLFSSAIQTFAKTGTSVNNRGVTLVRSEEHAMLLIRCPHILSEYHISNPFPAKQNDIKNLYEKHFVEADALDKDTDPEEARSMRVAHLPLDQLTAIFPEMTRYFVSPNALVNVDIEYGNIILEHVADEGAVNELEDSCPSGFGTDILTHLNARNARFQPTETRITGGTRSTGGTA